MRSILPHTNIRYILHLPLISLCSVWKTGNYLAGSWLDLPLACSSLTKLIQCLLDCFLLVHRVLSSVQQFSMFNLFFFFFCLNCHCSNHYLFKYIKLIERISLIWYKIFLEVQLIICLSINLVLDKGFLSYKSNYPRFLFYKRRNIMHHFFSQNNSKTCMKSEKCWLNVCIQMLDSDIQISVFFI